MSDTELTFAHQRMIHGKYPISLQRGQDVVFTERVNPHDPDDIERVIKSAEEQIPQLPVDVFRQQVLNLALPLTKEPSDRRDRLTYEMTDAGIVWHKPSRDGTTPTLLSNFNATIVAETIRDDGQEQTRQFDLEAKLAGTTSTFAISASQFSTMSWHLEKLGASAIVYPNGQEHLRAAIQTFSTPTIRVVYTHTGWREIGGKWLYIHAGGAIGSSGHVDTVAVELQSNMAGFKLELPTDDQDDLIACVRASLGLLDVAVDNLTIPLLATVYRSALGDCDLSVHLAGSTGVFKSELAALGQQHFGAGLDARHLPACWSSTDNALEAQAFLGKDAILVIDDFAPSGSPVDIQRWHQKADRVIRGAGNHSGRARLRADGSLRPTKSPRCLVISTGEDVPNGQSLRARTAIVEASPGDVNLPALTQAQAHARAGVYARCMGAYIKHLAANFAQTKKNFAQQFARVRSQAQSSSMHARTPGIVADLYLGMWLFLSFAERVGAVDKAQHTAFCKRVWKSLGQLAQKQAAFQRSAEPTQRYLNLLVSALTAGRAHLVSADSGTPDMAGACGWGSVHASDGVTWSPRGDKIGWIDVHHVHLDPDAAFRVAQQMAGPDGLSIPEATLRKRLNEKSLLVREPGRDELLARVTLDGRVQRVLRLRRATLGLVPPPVVPG